ncbi:MAG: hypothetical protein Sapg2KO_35910 [Saprospiraceae bacterium]
MDSDRNQKIKLQNKIEKTISTNELEMVSADLLEVVLDSHLDNEALEQIPLIKTIIGLGKGYLSIQDRIFTKKILTFLFQLKSRDVGEREEMINKVNESKKYRLRVGEKIMTIINASEDFEKAEIHGYIFNSFLEEKIDYTWFLECSFILNQVFLPDLYHIIKEDIKDHIIQARGDLLILHTGIFTPYPYSNTMRYKLSYPGELIVEIVKNNGAHLIK